MRRLSALTLPLLLVVLVVACGRNTQHEELAYQWRGNVANGQWLHLRDLNGSVHVEAATDGMVDVRAIQSWRGRRRPEINFRTDNSASGMYVCAMWGSAGKCGADGYSTRQSIWERIFRRRNNRNASVEFVVHVPPGVRVDASTVNGDVSVSGVSGEIKATTVNGDVTTSTHSGAVTATTVTGDVIARMDALEQSSPLRLTTVTGDVTAVLPATLGADVDMASVTGDLSTDFPLTMNDKSSHHLHGTIGNGGTKILLKTVTGEVRLRRGA